MSVSDTRIPAPVKVICLGLCRTGTQSLCKALDMMGFGPCYHYGNLIVTGKSHTDAWIKISDGPATPEAFDTLFQGYHSVLDQPPALFPEELYAAYPNAKFILTTRDPDKWATSMQNTIFPSMERALKVQNPTLVMEQLCTWSRDHGLKKLYGPDIFTNPRRIILEHNEKVERIIPEEKLLVYRVGEGWTRLCQFLEVDVPSEPFPHLNDTESYIKVLGGIEKFASVQGEK